MRNSSGTLILTNKAQKKKRRRIAQLPEEGDQFRDFIHLFPRGIETGATSCRIEDRDSECRRNDTRYVEHNSQAIPVSIPGNVHKRTSSCLLALRSFEALFIYCEKYERQAANLAALRRRRCSLLLPSCTLCAFT